ncbi:beta-lactamase family protein [Sphingobacterium sp. N143]|uniref:serine hydrolase domain-containing protein n=1 Tax=Sphingobacterium sp. N143 TaxID=2746727 RepID=UPI0025759AA7|nr:serine hydrolase domain-containing protein [Sphingobacterium sp. N143]MDM1296227.1 beta-lactamase family protein [Sphingobacterium sp. N143]
MKDLTLSFIFICITGMVMGQNMDKHALDNVLSGYYGDRTAPGIAVEISQQGRIVYRYMQGMADLENKREITENTHFRMASVSKQVTAQAIYTLLDQGKIKLDDQLSLFFDGLPKKTRGITIGQLLQHTSGLYDYEELIPKNRMLQVSDKDVLQYVKQVNRLYFPSGTKFRYSNTGYCLLSLIVAHVSKESFASFVKKNLFEPNGIADGVVYTAGMKIQERAYGYHPEKHSFVFADQSITSATQGDGGVYLSADEYHRWANFLLQKRLQEPMAQQLLHRLAQPVKEGIAYHLGWFICNSPDNTILFHSGESTGFHNMVYFDMKNKVSISIFSNRDDLVIGPAFDAILAILGSDNPIVKPTGKDSLTVFQWLNRVYTNAE